MIDEEELIQFQTQRAKEREAVRRLGEQIGFGNMMHLASEVWGEVWGVKGINFRVGPCAALTVPRGVRGVAGLPEGLRKPKIRQSSRLICLGTAPQLRKRK